MKHNNSRQLQRKTLLGFLAVLFLHASASTALAADDDTDEIEVGPDGQILCENDYWECEVRRGSGCLRHGCSCKNQEIDAVANPGCLPGASDIEYSQAQLAESCERFLEEVTTGSLETGRCTLDEDDGGCAASLRPRGSMTLLGLVARVLSGA